MERCLLCLKRNGMLAVNTNLNSTTIRDIIEKYNLPIEAMQPLSKICKTCWQKLYGFHEFYISVAEAQRQELKMTEETITELPIKEDLIIYHIRHIDSEESGNLMVKKELVDLPTEQSNHGLILKDSNLIPDILTENPPPASTFHAKQETDTDFILDDSPPPMKKVKLVNQDLTNIERREVSETTTNNNNQQPFVIVEQQEHLYVDDISTFGNVQDLSNDIESFNEAKANGAALPNVSSKKPRMSREESDELNKFIADNYKLACSICKHPMKNFCRLRKHIESTHEAKRGYALCCNKKLYTRIGLGDHLRLHSNPYYFKCQYCGRILSNRPSFELHLKLHLNSEFGKIKQRFRLSTHEGSIPASQIDTGMELNEQLLSNEMRIENNNVETFLCKSPDNNTYDEDKIIENILQDPLSDPIVTVKAEPTDINESDMLLDKILVVDNFTEKQEKRTELLLTESTFYDSDDSISIQELLTHFDPEENNPNNTVELKSNFILHKPSSDTTAISISRDESREYSHVLNKFLADNYKFYCSICDRTVSDFNDLRKHIKIKHKRRGFAVCCEKHFFTRIKLIDHIYTHLNPDYFTCQKCLMVMSSREKFESHLESHLNPDYLKCKVCDKEFLSHNTLKYHLSTHKNPSNKDENHDEALKKYLSITIESTPNDPVNEEMQQKYSEENLSLDETGKLSESMNFILEKPSAQSCAISLAQGFLRANTKEIDRFLADNYKFSCSICDLELTNFKDLKQHCVTAHKRSGSASCCKKHFYNRISLIDHLYGHLNPDYFKCQTCAIVFKNREQFETHLESHINPQEKKREIEAFVHENFQMSCSICQLPMKTFAILRKHFETMHNQYGYALCCNKKWYSKIDLVGHIHSHSNPNFLKCPHCDKIYSNRSNFKVHLKTHFKEKHSNSTKDLLDNIEDKHQNSLTSSERPEESVIKSYPHLVDNKNSENTDGKTISKSTTFNAPKASKAEINEFISNNFKFSCSFCNKPVDTFSELRKHIERTHSRRGFAICCKKKFFTRTAFVDHLNCHSNPDFLKCKHCGKVLASRQNYDIHVESHMKSNRPNLERHLEYH